MAEEKKYKTFAETFKISGFALAIGMMYPNRRTERIRVVAVLLMLFTFSPALVMMLFDLYVCYMAGDFNNFTRQITLTIPFVIIAVKIVIANIKRRDFEYIINEINSDLMCFNDLSEDYQQIIDQYIKSGLMGQTVWTIASLLVTGIFSLMATILMVHHNLKHNEVKRYMIHDLKVPYLGDLRYSSPYFEIIFVYMLYLTVFFIINFTGFDGTFCITVNHGSLKFKLMSHRLKRIFGGTDANNIHVIKHRIKEIIIEHTRILKYLNRVQNMYDLWLAMIFLLTLVQICTTLYQVTQSEQIDPKYLIFVVGSINHVYIPCHYAAVLTFTAADLSTDIYCCGWERAMDGWITDTVRFMIARAQRPLKLSAMGMVYFDMMLFVSMLQTSYSMYTLLTSN